MINRISTAKLVALGLLLFCVGLGIRLNGISQDAPQPDELHWLERSETLLNNFERQKFDILTSHLPHPGLPPSAIYAAAQWMVKRHNTLVGVEQGVEPVVGHGSVHYWDRLSAMRRVNAIVSSLIFPVLFVFLSTMLGVEVAFLSVALLVFSPNHIAACRMVHLDAQLALFVTLCVVLYVEAVRRGMPILKILSGVFWGLGIATKPTAGFILPALFAYSAIRAFLQVEADPRCYCSIKSRIASAMRALSWADVYMIITGHALLSLVYTRLWEPNSRYVYHFGIDNAVTRFVNEGGLLLQEQAMLFVVVLIVVFISGVSLLVGAQIGRLAGIRYNMQMITISVGSLMLLWGMFPVVFTNLARYWMWAGGLTGMKHRAYGVTFDAPSYGYLGLFFMKLPVVVLLGVGVVLGVAILACMYLIWRGRKELFQRMSILQAVWRSVVVNKKVREGLCFLLFCFLASTIWIALLSTSPKQTMRYVVPIIPLIYVIAACGLVVVYLLAMAVVLRGGRRRPGLAYSAFIVLVIAPLAECVLSWHSNYAFASNFFSGGVEAAIHSKRPLPVAGTIEVLGFLQNKVPAQGSLVVDVFGDLNILQYTYKREIAKGNISAGTGGGIRFVSDVDNSESDYYVVFPGFLDSVHNGSRRELERATQVFAYSIKGVPVLEVLEPSFPRYEIPTLLSLTNAPRIVGHSATFPYAKIESISAVPKGNRKGYLFFGRKVRVAAGKYKLEFRIAVNPAGGSIPDIRGLAGDGISANALLKTELGGCFRAVGLSDLGIRNEVGLQEARVVMECEFHEQQSLELRGYWFGVHEIYLAHPLISRIGE